MNLVRFVVDLHLDKLGRMLRMIGFDVKNAPSRSDKDLIQIAMDEERILLTKDRDLLRDQALTKGYFVSGIKPKEQLCEIVKYFSLKELMQPFTRCLECNGKIQVVGQKAVVGRVPEKILSAFSEFYICEGCQKIFWKGSHYDRMQATISSIIDDLSN